MNPLEKYTYGLFEFLKQRFSSRIIGYALVHNDTGYIEGRIDYRKFSVICNECTIIFETDYKYHDELIYLVKDIITDYTGNEIKICTDYILRESNSEKLKFNLFHSVNEIKETSYIKKMQ